MEAIHKRQRLEEHLLKAQADSFEGLVLRRLKQARHRAAEERKLLYNAVAASWSQASVNQERFVSQAKSE